ncbi:hypothetical protein F4779DRAFT_336904 [Xylariaceae sp. FL0662B]|nr:hypothetical protein F4779DRAFT_336904 [Xylariaceae sp. FL0662B]
MASSAKARQPRLRASCDGCFLAKVKCSKARPICSRCLACGIECRYSPSSRAGKPKSDHSNNNNSNNHSNSHQDLQHMHGLIEDKNVAYSASHQASPENMFRIETGWATPPTSVEGNMSRNPSISAGLALLGVEERAMGEHDPMSAPAELYSPVTWTPPTDLTFTDIPVMEAPVPGAPMRSQSFDVSMSTPMTWTEPISNDMISYSQVQTPTSMTSTYFPSPTTTPTMRPAASRHRSSSSVNGGSCTCFTACLQSLQALHNASSPAAPPFDLVLSLNRKAVEGCAAMLSCNKCINRSGTHTATMLLATVIGKITSFYKNATHSYFESGSSMGIAQSNAGNTLGVSLGVYQLNGEDGKWLELEILARELRKLEEVYARFREVCTDLSEDPEVTKAMIGYLGHNLGSTLEVISHRKGGMTFVT